MVCHSKIAADPKSHFDSEAQVKLELHSPEYLMGILFVHYAAESVSGLLVAESVPEKAGSLCE